MTAAELRSRARHLDGLALAAEDQGQPALAESRRVRAYLDRRAAVAVELREIGARGGRRAA